MLLPKTKRWLDNSSAQSFAFDLLRLLRDKFKRTDFYKKKLLQRVDYISYASPTLTNYAKSITNEYDKKIIEPLPFGFFENIKEESRHPNEVIISVPGVVVEEARDYEMLFQVFEKVLPKIKKSIKLQLLGSSNNKSGKKIIQKFKNLEKDNFQLVYFQSALSQKEFDTFLRQTDFMILPIKKYRKFGLCKEEYGVSNISGGLNDMLRFGIPTLLTQDYKAESFSEMLVSYFENKNELVDLLREWINGSKFIEKRKAAIPFLEDYNEEKTRERLVDNLNNLYP